MTSLRLPILFNTLFAFALEVGALVVALSQPSNETTIASFFLIHGLACFIGAITLTNALPAAFRQPFQYTWLFLVGYLFFIPFLALLVATTTILTSRFWTATLLASPHFSTLEPIAYEPPTVDSRPINLSANRKYGEGGLRARLHNNRVNTSERVRTMLSLQNMTTRVMNPMLRESLTDQIDDIRLLAYGLLDRQEKSINQRIHQELTRFNTTTDGDQLNAARRIAELYWELIYQGLALGDLKIFAAQTALHYANFALEKLPTESGLYFLRGRILDILNHYDNAEEALQTALNLGLPPAKALPYLAEIAYKKQNYTSTRQLLRQLDAKKTAPILAPVIRFWQ